MLCVCCSALAALHSKGIMNPKIGKVLFTLNDWHSRVLGQIVLVAIWQGHVKEHGLSLFWFDLDGLARLGVAPTNKRRFATRRHVIQVKAQVDGSPYCRISKIVMGCILLAHIVVYNLLLHIGENIQREHK